MQDNVRWNPLHEKFQSAGRFLHQCTTSVVDTENNIITLESSFVQQMKLNLGPDAAEPPKSTAHLSMSGVIVTCHRCAST